MAATTKHKTTPEHSCLEVDSMAGNDVPVNRNTDNRQQCDEKMKFEDIIEDIGSSGKFQLHMNIIFNCLSVIFTVMAGQSKLIALTVPEHWCHVPGRDVANLSMEIWKNFTIPRDEGVYSSCLMYKVPGMYNETIPCTYGWDYDDTWLSATVTSQENWVCDKGIYASTVFSTSIFTSVPFTSLLFYCGDRFGRRIQYLVTQSLSAVCHILLTVSSSVLPLYTIFLLLANASILPNFESTLSIGIELTGIKHRSSINYLSWFSFSVGVIAMVLLAWLTRNWTIFLLISSVLCIVPILFQKYLPESPRWLVSQGHPGKALKILQCVAVTNGKLLPDDTTVKLNFLSQQRSHNFGIKTIFTNRNLFKNTVFITYAKSANILTTFTMMFSTKSFGGNPFLVYIGKGVLQLPSVSVAHYAGNRFGRRVTHCISLLFGAVVSSLLIYPTTASSPQWMVIVGSVALLFCSLCSASLTNLQSLEIHPTCIRQITLALESIVVSIVMGVTPYLAYLGRTAGLHYMYIILASVLLSASVLISFVPESLHEKLPETLEDAALYGCKQKYWSLPSKVKYQY